MDSSNLYKFPAVMATAFDRYNLTFFDGTEWKYDPVKVYRMVLREKDDYSQVTKDDFMSLAEAPRRGREKYVKKPDYYGVSVFTEKEALVNKLKLPKPRKKIASGHIQDSYGPIYRKLPHICLWCYKDVDFSNNDFVIGDYE